MSITSLVHHILSAIIFVIFIVCNADSQNETSCFSFFYTDEKSPANLEKTCFEMTSSSVNKWYQGVSMYIMRINNEKPSSCSFGDIKLETIQKYIIEEGTRQRRLCRTKMIFSVNTTTCEDEIKYLDFYCIGNVQRTKSLFFQDCASANCPREMDESRENRSEALVLSQFPEPTVSQSGLFAYDIPASHCDMKQCRLENCSTEQLKKFKESTVESKANPTKDQNKECLLFTIGSGSGGLLVGILSTSVTCFLLNKYKKNYRNVGEVSFSKQNVHLLSETERKLPIHSKEGETVYHDISDIPGPSKERVIQYGVSNLLIDDSPEQRYSESPKSSTSAYENGSSSSELSAKSEPTKAKEKQMFDKPQFYHTLARDYKVSSGNVIKPSCKQVDFTDTDNNHKTETKSTKETKQYSVYESPVGQHHVSISQEVEQFSTDLSDDTVEDLLETEVKVSENLPGVYHALEEEKGRYVEEMSIEIESKADQDKRSSNGTSSQKEYYVIMAKSPEKESSSSES